MLNMIHYFNDWIIASTILAISINSDNISFPPNWVIDLVDNIIATVKKFSGIHDIVKPRINFNISWKVNNFDIDLFKVSTRWWIGVIDVKWIRNVWIEDLCSRLLVLTENMKFMIRIQWQVINLLTCYVD